MTLDEARQWLASNASGDRRHEGIGHAGYVDLYETADEATRGKLLDAMTFLLVDGNDSDQLLASSFFARAGAPPPLLRDLATAYVTRKFDGHHPLADLLGRLTYQMSEDVAAILVRQFNADPVRQFGLSYAVLRHDKRGPTWDNFVRALPSIDQADDLVTGFRAAFAAQRVDDYFALLRGRPESLLRAVASRLSHESGQALLAAAL